MWLRLAIGTWSADESGTLLEVDERARGLLGSEVGTRPDWTRVIAEKLRVTSRVTFELDRDDERFWITASRIASTIEGIVQDASGSHSRHVFDHAPVAMHSIDRHGRIRDVNRKWLELTGYTRNEVLGQDTTLFLTLESARRATEEVMPRFWREGLVRAIPYELIRKDGSVLEIELDCDATMDLEGRPASISVVRDVTERNRTRRALEERDRDLRTLIERMPDALLLHRDGVIVYANPSAAALLGREGDLAGERLPEALRGDPGSARLFEARVALTDGSERLVEVGRLSLRVAGERTDALLARDITERRELQARLAQADRLATVGTLAAAVAHEVNNPLTFVMHFVGRLRKDLETAREVALDADQLERLMESARIASEGVLRVRDIVRDLKTFARIEDEGAVPLDVNRALRSAIQLASHQIQLRARLSVELGALPVVRANDGRLCQVFLNLLLNAAQAIDEGAVDENEVRVTSWSGGAHVYVAVEDSGSGIDPRHLARLFEPFFSTKPRHVGSGLGLWICREIVHGFGGHLEIESRAARGSTFTVVLPSTGSHAVAASSVPPPPGATIPLRLGAPIRRVLVVDDEPALRDLLAEALSERAQVLTASSGLDACDLLRHDDAFDAILCDVVMPGMSGVELYDWVHRHVPELARRVVFMTGDAFSPSVRSFLSRVGNTTLHKPFRVREVERALDEIYTSSDRARP